MQTFKDIIDAFGGAASMALALDDPAITANLVRQWAYRNNIPSEYWQQIVACAEVSTFEGVTLEVMAAIAAAKKAA